MGERTQYSPGTFSWTDLTTPDQEAAKQYYSSLFGWEIQDMPAGDDATYSMAFIDNKPVAAISPQPPQQADAGAPPVWNSYVTVESADAALEKAKRLGGSVHAPAFDVLDAGRMGVVQDPQGAYFLVWQPNTHIGAGLVNAPGALAWNELHTPDMDAAAQFYGELFGWTTEPVEGMEMPYMTITKSDGTRNGGIAPTMGNEPPYWLVYLGTDDLDSSLATAEELGGNKIVGPINIGPGSFAVAQDPQGAVFALYSGQFES